MILLKRGGGGTVLSKEDKTVTCVLVVYRKQLLISPELIYLCKVFWRLLSEGAYVPGDLYPREPISEGLISYGAYIQGGFFNRNKKNALRNKL